MQSRRMSAIENIVRIAIGLVTGGLLHFTLYTYLDHDGLYFWLMPVAFALHSFVLGYIIRRVFEARRDGIDIAYMEKWQEYNRKMDGKC